MLEILREIGWVIFDEIHYMRDKERGVVWEETIILLPDTCRFVFLSATIPNAREFAFWIAKIHSQVNRKKLKKKPKRMGKKRRGPVKKTKQRKRQ